MSPTIWYAKACISSSAPAGSQSPQQSTITLQLAANPFVSGSIPKFTCSTQIGVNYGELEDQGIRSTVGNWHRPGTMRNGRDNADEPGSPHPPPTRSYVLSFHR